MNGVEWHTEPEDLPAVSPRGFLWRAYVGTWYIGTVYNDGWSAVDGDVIDHGSIHMAALHVQRAAEAYAKKEGSL